MNNVCTQEEVLTLQEEALARQDEIDFMYRQAEIEDWRQQQREKAPGILALLRKHMPADRMQEVEEFLTSKYGCDCLHDTLCRDLTRNRLRGVLPENRWQDIERYLDTGIFESQGDHELFVCATEGLPWPGW